jgi:LacI family transcriptional regulator
MPNRKRFQKPGEKKPSLEDVAKRADVSSATVSRYLSNPDLVREKRRSRISAAIKDLGYIPHGAARALASRRSSTIGAIVPTLDNAIFAKGIQSFQAHLQSAGYTLFVASSNYSLSEEQEQAETLITRGVDGILLVGLNHDPRLFKQLEQAGIPYINTWAYDSSIGQPCVGFDNYDSARRLAEYLIDLGHRRFGVISGVTRDNDRAFNRLNGVRDALSASSIDLPNDAIIECHYDLSDGRQAMRWLLNVGSPPTAIICGNDVLAYGAVIECQDGGLDVPADVSVVGFDDLPMSRHIRPTLTTMHVPSEEMGRRAAEYLIARLTGKDTPEYIELEVSLIVRGSTARPRNSFSARG